jgi:hypothetical protein
MDDDDDDDDASTDNIYLQTSEPCELSKLSWNRTGQLVSIKVPNKS